MQKHALRKMGSAGNTIMLFERAVENRPSGSRPGTNSNPARARRCVADRLAAPCPTFSRSYGRPGSIPVQSTEFSGQARTVQSGRFSNRAG